MAAEPTAWLQTGEEESNTVIAWSRDLNPAAAESSNVEGGKVRNSNKT